MVATVRGPSPLSRTTIAADAVENASAESRESSRDASGSSSLDPTTISVAKSEVEVAYERFAGVMGAVDVPKSAPSSDTRDTRDTPPVDETVDTTADDGSFHDALDATARSSTFASAGEAASAFDADALVSSTFDDVFGDGDGSGDDSGSGGGDDGVLGDRGDDAEDGDGDSGGVASGHVASRSDTR